MSITVNTKAYTADSFSPDAVGYQGPAHTLSSKDLLSLKRIAPKPTATFKGVAKGSAKFTRTVSTGTDTSFDAIVEVTYSLPVGISEADVDSIRDDMGDLLLLQAADDLFLKQDINA